MEDEYNYPPRMKWADRIKELEKENAELKIEIIELENTIEYLTVIRRD